MIITNIGDLKKTLKLNNKRDNELYDNAVFLYELLDHYEGIFSDINIQLETVDMLNSKYNADLNTIISTLIYRIVGKLDLPDFEIQRLFNNEIKSMVRKLLQFDNESNSYNNKLQLIKSITSDVRITIIKLVERLVTFNHIYKHDSSNKQDYVTETLSFYVPISRLLGIYNLKNQLEDACFKFNNSFDAASNIVKQVNKEYKTIIKNVDELIASENINLGYVPRFKINRKSGYDIYRKAKEIKQKVNDLNKTDYINLLGFCSIKCLLNSREDCYKIIYLLHKFRPILGSFSDYIGGAEGDEYHAIHTSVFIKNHVVDFRVCTNDMDYVNYYGVTSSWNDDSNLQERLSKKYSFYPELLILENKYSDEELVNVFIENILEKRSLNSEYFDIEEKEKTR